MFAMVRERVKAIALPLLEEQGLELLEVQYRREQHGWVLRLVIDKPGGVSLDDCVAISRELSQILDVEDFVDQAYNLEVSSPGLDRPLKSLADFQRFSGRMAKVVTSEPLAGTHVFVGRIQETEGDSIVLEVDRRKVVIPFPQVARARLEVEF